jgi:hypothetical protein
MTMFPVVAWKARQSEQIQAKNVTKPIHWVQRYVIKTKYRELDFE